VATDGQFSCHRTRVRTSSWVHGFGELDAARMATEVIVLLARMSVAFQHRNRFTVYGYAGRSCEILLERALGKGSLPTAR